MNENPLDLTNSSPQISFQIENYLKEKFKPIFEVMKSLPLDIKKIHFIKVKNN